MTKVEKSVRLWGISLCELFALGTIIILFTTGQANRLPLAFGTILLILLPAVMERLFSCKFSLPVYIFALLYAIGPMLGQCYNLYYTVSWWNRLLHICGGVMFAIVGIFLFHWLNQNQNQEKKNVLLAALFALCFSMALSMVWEFVEFGSDQLLHTDMQDDTVITALYSYLLADGPGVAGSLENIGTVVIDGTALPVNGYIDIGLIDTMLDMLVETLGALSVCILYLIDRGNHPLIRTVAPEAAPQFRHRKKGSA